jgi:hypothetical protein
MLRALGWAGGDRGDSLHRRWGVLLLFSFLYFVGSWQWSVELKKKDLRSDRKFSKVIS